jgi:hypothetical protein
VRGGTIAGADAPEAPTTASRSCRAAQTRVHVVPITLRRKEGWPPPANRAASRCNFCSRRRTSVAYRLLADVEWQTG